MTTRQPTGAERLLSKAGLSATEPIATKDPNA